MKLQKHMGAAALVALMAGTMPLAVVAQTEPSAPAAEDVSGEELDAFVVAYKDVQAIDAKYGAQMSQTTDQAELQSLQQQAQVEKTEAVEATSGIDVDRYMAILTVAQSDPDMTSRILAKLEQ